MIPTQTQNSIMENQDLFSKLGTGGGDDNQNVDETTETDFGDPFNDSGGLDLFEKLMEDSALKSSSGSLSNSFNNNVSVGDNNMMHDSQMLLYSALNKSDNSFMNPKDIDTDDNGNLLRGGSGMQNQQWDNSFPLSVGTGGGANMMPRRMLGGGNNQPNHNWFQNIVESPTVGSQPMMDNMMNNSTALDAAPLNISLGRGVGVGSGCLGFSSTLRRKGSNMQLNSSLKSNQIHKASKTLKSSKSEGLLARALKAKYNSSNQLSSTYSMNAEQVAAAMAGASSQTGNAARMMNHSPSMNAIGSGGAQNASWRGTQPARTSSGSSMIKSMLLNRNRSSSKLQSSDSTSALFNAKLQLGSSASKSSMQDLLRLSRKQSKTQSMLRQSSAHSLFKQTSSHSLRDASGKVDVSSLLPPEHANSRRNMASAANNNIGGGGQANATFATSNMGSDLDTESLLHQSCRLYPTTHTVVESALRIDPDAVRRAVATAVEQGSAKKAGNVYGYPINVALTHGASMEVLKMLGEAGPDVLVQKDGTDGSGSLGIALSTKCDMSVVDLLIRANPQCVRIADRRGNYPLHVAVNHGLPLQIVKRLFSMYPRAQEMRNFHSQTPLDIAQRSTRCPEEVMNFLQSSAYSNLDTGALHIDHNPGNLEDGLDDIMQTNF